MSSITRPASQAGLAPMPMWERDLLGDSWRPAFGHASSTTQKRRIRNRMTVGQQIGHSACVRPVVRKRPSHLHHLRRQPDMTHHRNAALGEILIVSAMRVRFH